MGSSPFHGIFSALNKGIRKNGADASTDDAALQPLQQQEQQDSGPVGRVAVDIYEQDDYYIVKAPIAGVRMTDLDIEVNDNVLTIRGNRRQQDTVPSDQYYLQECFWGPFSRSVTLPMQIDARKVRATFSKDCVLKILIPREEKVRIVRINEG